MIQVKGLKFCLGHSQPSLMLRLIAAAAVTAIALSWLSFEIHALTCI